MAVSSVELFGVENLSLVESLYDQYIRDPEAVDAEWREYFKKLENGDRASIVSLGPSFKPSSIFSPASARLAAASWSANASVANGLSGAAAPMTAPPSPAALARLPFIKKLSLFKDISERDQLLVAGILQDVHLRQDDYLFYAGAPGDALYIITEGMVRVDQGGQTVTRLGAGEVVGEMALMDSRPRFADVVAETDVKLLKLLARDLDQLLNQHGQIARGLFHLVAQRLRETSVRQERVDHLIRAYRVRGHVIANLDPLGRRPTTHPELELSYHGLSESDLDLPVSSRTMESNGSLTLRQIIQRLRNTYCRSIGVQFMHIDNLRVKNWLQARMENSENRLQLSRQEQVRILTKLTDAEAFETFIHKKFLGAKRFSLEGGESLIPLLDMAIEEATVHGVREMVIGMPHRGRLNVLANIMGKSPQQIFEEFEDVGDPKLKLGKGDVKYHMGYSSDRQTAAGASMHLSLCFNPSHLEFVGPVVAGRVRAKQDRLGDKEHKKVLGVVIHGDAAFAGQGVVQEMLNMSELPGYATGGTVHIIVNNQIGFTTPPESSRSSQYATDVAKMLEIPIFHVNGEDPEGVAQVIKLAMEFRETFQRDVIIDMYCYRRHGHNEGDEPTFTQPVMYQWVQKQPSVRESYLENLIKLGGITREEAEEISIRCRQRLEEELNRAKTREARKEQTVAGNIWLPYVGGEDLAVPEVNTGLAKDQLIKLLEAQTLLPADFHAHPKIVRFLEQRRDAALGKRPLDWGTAEALAFASLLVEGARIRLSGQDSGRGTFSHRHAVLHDYENGQLYIPLQHVAAGQAEFNVWDSPLSETGVLGFDYGYSLDSPDALVLWEAQFGDFANGAQVIIDQFISSSEDKWQRLSGLVMLLPHGFEGQGPEHSSARLERFLNLAAEDNMQVVYPTTPAQFFHCLRRQILRRIRKPLVVMSPKSLLRHPAAISSLDEFTTGHFRRVLGDSNDPKQIRRVLLCSGKVYYDLAQAREERGIKDIAIIRLEQLYPAVEPELKTALAAYADGTPVWWVQEEPINMGAWNFMQRTFGGQLFDRLPLAKCVARAESASPATGSPSAHKYEQALLLEQAFA